MPDLAIKNIVSAADIIVVARLAHEIWQEYYPAIIGQAQVDYMLPRDYGHAVIADELAAGQICWELATWRTEPVGFSSYGPLNAADGDLWLRKLYVHRNARGTACGWRLVERVIATAQAGGFEEVALRVNKGNALAISRYERMGFHVRLADTQPIGNGFVMDDYVMALRVR